MRMQRRIALIVGAVLAALSRMGFILTANGGTFQSFSIRFRSRALFFRHGVKAKETAP